jgi:hypothetical protein
MTSFNSQDMLDFEGTETPGNPSLIPTTLYAQFIPYIVFKNENPLY